MLNKIVVLCASISFLFVACVNLDAHKLRSKTQIMASVDAVMQKYGINRTDCSVLISIPKSGTHLMTRILSLMPVKGFSFDPYDWDSLGVLQRRKREMMKAIKRNARLAPKYCMGLNYVPQVGPFPKYILQRMKSKTTRSLDAHWPYTSEAEELFYRSTEANFFILRDPRDMIVSMAYMLYKGPNENQADVTSLVCDFIDGRKKAFIPWGVAIHTDYPLLYTYGVTQYYKLYLPWMQARKFMTVRFEDLVGDEGGGSSVIQMGELKRIAKHLNVALTEEQFVDLRANIFGKSSTFRAGKIGSWKQHFTPEMIAAYKAVPGACQLLVDLGYEKDSKW